MSAKDDFDAGRDPVERLAEEFAERRRRGERPSVAEYIARYPQWAEQIQALFPALALMEEYKSEAEDRTGSNGRVTVGPSLERLGDYRILREIGRGGMGIVYEAEQESLGRRVALKVLPAHTRSQPTLLARFRREAMAAARLHHTHIVPIYGVGESDGLHYYVMQYIAGRGLDEVLEGIRRLRHGRPEPASLGVPDRPTDADRPFEVSSTALARALWTGRFAAPAEAGDLGPEVEGPPGRRGPGSMITAEWPAGPRVAGDPGGPVAPADRPVEAPGPAAPTDESGLSGRASVYWRAVARIGRQVAEALEHAHVQGVLHRDIKPSNLLLDLQGDVWVTDFGVAKLEDGEGPTLPGDIAGTLRYMAPERFEGCSDVRADVYGLGLTLYEMLTLRPAFDATDRARLLHQVEHESPPRPHAVNAEVPRDLETIALKTIERDPARRYQTASELAEDLRRFLEDRPIRARRTGPVERAWRWARRNPTIAALGLLVVVLLAAIVGGSMVAAIRLAAERDRALDHLWDSYLAQARAGRSTQQVGRRFTSLEALARAARIRVNDAVRDEAIACLALVDLRPVHHLATVPHEDDGFAVDPALERYALGDEQGNVSVRRVVDGREIVRLPRGDGPNRGLEFSPDGRYVIATYAVRRRLTFVVWDLGSGRAPAKVMERTDHGLLFPPDGRRIATRLSETVMGLFDAATGRLEKRLTVAPVSAVLGFHPDGRRLMVQDASACTLRLIDTERGGADVWSHTFEVEMGGMALRGDGRLLASAGNDHRIYVWDMVADRLQAILEGHKNLVVALKFTHAGGLLFSSAWDGTTRVWDPIRGTLLFTAPGNLFQIGPDDWRLAMCGPNSRLAVWELGGGQECRALHHGMVGNRTPRPKGVGPTTLHFSSDGGLLASADFDGIRLWDPATGAPVAHLPGNAEVVQFSPVGSHLLTDIGAYRRPCIWPLRAGTTTADVKLRIGPPRPITADETFVARCDAWERTGRYVTAIDSAHAQAVVLDLATATEVARLGPHRSLHRCPISPDGHWIATATWKGKDVKVWEVATGRLAWELPCDSAFATFSPDGRWLAVIAFPKPECRLWHVGSWGPGPRIHLSSGVLGAMAFARDGRLFAIDDAGRVRLVDPDTGREVATLSAGIDSPSNFTCLAFSPDGTRLAAGCDHIIHLWDLRRIRAGLAAIGLDWDRPPYPPLPPGAREAGPPRVVIDSES